MKKTNLLCALALLVLPSMASADVFTAVTVDNNLVTFDSSAPGVILTSAPVTGLASGGGNLVNLAYNPTDGLYYGLDFAANFYSIDSTGAATQIPSTFAPTGFSGGLAWDPSGGVLVFVSESAELYTITTTGTATKQPDFVYSPGDANDTETPSLTAIGFDPDFNTPYFINPNTNTLVTNLDINLGSADTVGPLGFDVTPNAALMVDSLGNLYASLSTDGFSSSFYSIDAGTGAATLIGNFASGVLAITGTAAVPEPSAALLGLASLGLMARRRRTA